MKGEGWKSVAFEELVEFHDRHRIPLSKKERAGRSGPFPYYGAQGVIDSVDDYIFDGRYLLIAEDGENLRSRRQPVAYMADGQFWVNNHAHVVKAVKGVADDDFLRAYVEFHPLSGLITGAAQPKLSQSNLKRLSVTAPPYIEQTRIGESIRAVDSLLQSNRRLIEILEEMARLLYREWFVHLRFPGHEDSELIDSDIGPIPDGWKAGKFSDLVSEIKQTVSPDDISEGTPVVGLQHLPRRSTTLYEWEEASQVGSRRKIFSEGDILFGKIRPYFHKVVDAPISGCSSTDTIVFRPKEESFRCRALAVASSDEFVGVATATSNGTKMPRANTGVLMNYCIPHPTHDVEQAFSDTVGPIDSLRKTLAAQNRVLRRARNLLLPRLVSGELDVSELDMDLVVEAV